MQKYLGQAVCCSVCVDLQNFLFCRIIHSSSPFSIFILYLPMLPLPSYSATFFFSHHSGSDDGSHFSEPE